jgi:DNA polymerase III alpha subunit
VAAYAELHCHTHFSFLDGASAPDELVARAVELGMSGLAITDHGGLYGVVRFETAAREAGLRPIIGIEIELADAAVPDQAGLVIPGRREVRRGRSLAGGRAAAVGSGGHSLAGGGGGVAVPVFGARGSFGGAEPFAIPSSLANSEVNSLASSHGDARRGEGLPVRPRPDRARLPGDRNPVKEDLRGVGEGQRGPHLVLLARNAAGYRSLCRLVSRANMAGTKAMPRFSHELLVANTEGLVALSGCREGEIARRLRAGDREGAKAAAEYYARLFAARYARHARADSAATAAFFLEMQHHLLPDDDWLVAETARLAGELGLPVVVTNDVHYAHREGREMQDVLTAIRHGRALGELRDLRRPDGESYLKSEDELMALPPAEEATPSSLANSQVSGRQAAEGATPSSLANSQVSGRQAAHTASSSRDLPRPTSTGSDTQNASAGIPAAWVEGMGNAGEVAASCSVSLGFERYRFPGFPIPKGHTPFSYLEDLCHVGARRRYHPISSPVLRQLAHELDVIEKTGLAEFFLICWDIMRFAREQKIPAQGRGSAANSIAAYVLGITRVDPIRHNLLFERFINEGRTSYPDIDIDFSSERREEVIQYVYRRYGPEHTGMVCNLVTYRARSAVREVGHALGFPRPLVDRVAKALETYDSVMVRRDLEAEGGFGQFFAETVERGVAGEAAAPAARGAAAGVAGSTGSGAGGAGALTAAAAAAAAAVALTAAAAAAAAAVAAAAAANGFTDRTGQLNRPRGGRIDGGVAPSGRGQFPYINPQSASESLNRVSGLEAAEPSPGAVKTVDSNGSGVNSSGSAGGHAWNRGHAGSQQLSVRPSMASAPTYHSAHRYRETGAGATSAADLGGGSAIEQQRRIERWRRSAGSDDEGGPGDSAASIARLAAERREVAERPPIAQGAAASHGADAEGLGPTIALGGVSPDRDSHTASIPGAETEGLSPPSAQRDRPAGPVGLATALAPAQLAARSDGGPRASAEWERWLEFCARIDGFPRHLSIHTGGMLVTAAPLIDIAPLERATMPGRVVVQFDKRDVETLKLIKLDLLGLGMLAAIDETLQLIEHDCGACVDLDRLPEDVPEVFQMIQAADTVGVFQIESRAQMQTLPKSRPANLDDLVVEVAIIRPGPIQGNAVHPYLRRRQGLEPVTYLHPSLEPVLRETLGVILYQEQVMNITIIVAGFTAGESDGFRRAMGTWRSTKEMEKLHRRFVDGCIATNGLPEADAEELFRRLAAFASFGFAKSHAAAFARTAYESSFLKLFYQAQFTVGLVNAQPMGFYPVEVLINDAKRHGVAVLPVDINASTYKTTTEWVGWAGDGDDDGGIRPRFERPVAIQSSGCILPSAASRQRWTPESATGYGIRLGLALVKGVGEQHAERLDVELARGPYETLADVVARTDLPEEVIERLIRAGALDSLGRPRRELLWQLHEVMGATRGSKVGVRAGGRTENWGPTDGRSRAGGWSAAPGGRGRPGERAGGAGGAGARADGAGARADGAGARADGAGARADGAGARTGARAGGWTGRSAGRPADLRLPPTPAPELPDLTEQERLGDSYAVLQLDAQRQVISLFRPALDRLGAVTNASLADRGPGPVRLGGLVVTRQHPMTAKGTVFLALEDETGMVNVTLWPDAWARLRGVVRRHALLYVDGMLQREGNVVNVVAREIRPLPEVAERVGEPAARPDGVRSLGYSGMRRG